LERRRILNYIIIFLIISSLFSGVTVNSDSGDDWIIDGDMVYIDNDKVYASAEPHTINGRQWVEFNFRSKVYTGDVSFVWGFDTPDVKPLKCEIWQNYEHILTGYHWVEHWGNKIIENVTSYDNLGIENYDNYTVTLGNDNNTYLFRVWVDSNGNGTSLPYIYAFSDYSVNDDDYTLSGNYDSWGSYEYPSTFYDWKPFTPDWEIINYNYGGANKWYLLDGVPITQGVNYKIRALITAPASIDGEIFKYWWAFKPSSETLAEAIGNGHFYALDPWADSSYNYYKTIHIPASQVRSTLSNFPILVNITDTALIAKCQANGEDIRFYADDNTTALYYEIQEWTPAGANVWVNVTSLASTGTNINMYYGNAGASDGQDSANVWDSNFQIVYHFNYSTGGCHDSTGNHNTGTVSGDLPTYSSQGIGGWYFDGTDDFITTPDFSLNEHSTIEGFVQSDDDNLNNEIWDFADSGGRTNQQEKEIRMGDNKIYSRLKWGASEHTYYDVQNPGTGNRYHVQSWQNGNCHHSMDTVIYSTGSVSTSTYSPGIHYVGCNYDTGNNHNGLYYEFRISNIRRSIAWEETTFNTLSNTTTFCIFGEEHESETANNNPAYSNELPTENSVNQLVNPQISIDIEDPDGDNMNVSFWSNTSGSWKVWATSNNQGNGTITKHNENFTNWNTKFWWNVTLDDGEGGTVSSPKYNFTTIPNYASTVSNPSPINGSTSGTMTPLLSIDLSDPEGNTSSIGWESNSSGSWKDFASTTGAGNGSHTATGTNFTEPLTKYWWRVTVTNDDYATYNTSTFYFTTVANYAPVITNPVPANGSIGQDRPPLTSIDINDPEGDTFNVSWQSNSSGSWKTWGTNLTQSNGTISDTNANFSSSNTTYWWRVVAHDGAGSNTSDIYHFKTLEGVDKPSNFVATRTEATNDIVLTWTKHTNATHTRIQRKTGSYPTSITDGTNVYNSTGATHTDSTTSDAIIYYYSAWSYTSIFNEWSPVYATATNKTRPITPNTLVVSVVSNNTLNLTWVKGTGADKTEIRYQKNVMPATVSDGSSAYNDTATGTDVTGLEQGATYHFKAFSWNDTVKLFSYGNDTGFNTTSSQPSNATNLVATPYNDTQINLTWTAGNGTASVLVRNNFNYPITPTNGSVVFNSSGSSYEDTGLNASQEYFYSIWSYNVGLFSEGYNYTSNYTRPQVPQNATGDLEGMAVNLTWDNASGADNYILMKKNGGYPQNLSDGTELYNGTGWFHNDTTFTTGDLYSMWSYNNDTKLYSRMLNVLWGGLRINVYDEETGNAVSQWNALITNYVTSVEYSAQNNPTSIDINLLPYGDDTVILINATNYLTRIYIMDIEPNNVYTLNAYIPKENASNLSHYIITVKNEVEQAVRDVKINIKRYISGAYKTILEDLSDGAGQIDVYLFANELYIVELTHYNYITQTTHWRPPTIVYYDDALKEFILEANVTDFENTTYYKDSILFNGYRDGSQLYVNYTDSLLMTVSADFVVYEINTTTGVTTAYYWYNFSNQSITFNFTVDPNNHYRVELSLEHLLFKDVVDSFLIKGDKELPTSKAEFDSLFEAIFGANAIKWSAIAGLFTLLACLFMFGQRHVGVGISLAGIVMIAINAGLGLAFMNMTLSIVIFIFGILVEWRSNRRAIG